MVAFYQLIAQRHIDGMGAIGSIRYEAITQWLDQNAIQDEFDRDRYRFYIAAADRAYVAIAHEQREREAAKLKVNKH